MFSRNTDSLAAAAGAAAVTAQLYVGSRTHDPGFPVGYDVTKILFLDGTLAYEITGEVGKKDVRNGWSLTGHNLKNAAWFSYRGDALRLLGLDDADDLDEPMTYKIGPGCAPAAMPGYRHDCPVPGDML